MAALPPRGPPLGRQQRAGRPPPNGGLAPRRRRTRPAAATPRLHDAQRDDVPAERIEPAAASSNGAGAHPPPDPTSNGAGGAPPRLGGGGGAPPAAAAPPPAAAPPAWGTAWWAALAPRHRLVAATSLAFVLCNMDKVNLSIAIIPMADEFGWSPTTAGLVQSSFFWGYALTQVPGGWLSRAAGGHVVLPAGVGLWSAATAAVPALAAAPAGLLLSRAAVGLGEGLSPSAATDLAARAVPPGERSRAVAVIFGGLPVGSVLGLVLAPALIDALGWRAVFLTYGAAGGVWLAWWRRLLPALAAEDPALGAALARGAPPAGGAGGEPGRAGGARAAAGGGGGGVPWRGFARSGPLRALAFSHFANNWLHFTMLAWLPTFFLDSLSLDLGQASAVALLPPAASIAVMAVAGPAADAALAAGVPTGRVRKGAQAAAHLGAAACLAGAAAADGSPAAVAFIAAALGVSSFSVAGLYCNHADLSPRHAPVLLGLTSTAGALPGVFGVALTGWAFEQTQSWALALFAPSAALLVAATAAFVAFGSAEPQNFEDFDGPLFFERLLPGSGGGDNGAGSGDHGD